MIKKICILLFVFICVGCSSIAKKSHLDEKKYSGTSILESIGKKELYVFISMPYEGGEIKINSIHNDDSLFSAKKVYESNLNRLYKDGKKALFYDCIIINNNGYHKVCADKSILKEKNKNFIAGSPSSSDSVNIVMGSVFNSKKLDWARMIFLPLDLALSALSSVEAFLMMNPYHMGLNPLNHQNNSNFFDEKQVVLVGNYINNRSLSTQVLSQWKNENQIVNTKEKRKKHKKSLLELSFLDVVGRVAVGVAAVGPVVSVICGDDGCPVDDSFEQNKNVKSNVASGSTSKGIKSDICFYFNNTNELDSSARLIIENKNKNYIKTDTKGFFGDHCISGRNGELGGGYLFTYITKNRVRKGEFSISGDYSRIDIELDKNFIKSGPFDIEIREYD